jgi:hypothetical protein
MSAWHIITLLAYSCALIGALFSKPDTENVKWLLLPILILIAHIADKATP